MPRGVGCGPADVIVELVRAKQNTDQCAAALGQRLLEEYGRRGHLDEGIARSRTLYRRRCDILLRALEDHVPDGVAWTRPVGGFFSWLSLPRGLDSMDLSPRAMEARVAYVPGVPFYPDGRGDLLRRALG
jgi:2-aminoadipate transaminase